MIESITPNLDSPEKQSTIPWGGVTDPTLHNPYSFRYLVHLDSGRPVEGDGTNPESEWEYLLGKTDRVKSAGLLSASLVDQDHPVLWQGTSSNHGFIIEVPDVGIVASSARDMFTKDKTIEFVSSRHPVKLPDSLLADTPAHDHNEVLFSAKDAVVKAFFWVEPQVKDEVPPYTREEVIGMARNAGLPFLELDLLKY